MRLYPKRKLEDIGGGKPLAFSQQHLDSSLRGYTDYRATNITLNDVTSKRAIDGTIYRNTSGKIMVITVAVESCISEAP